MQNTSIDDLLQDRTTELRLLADAVRAETHCALPGTVIRFEPGTQTASIRLGVRETYGGRQIELPILADVPVFFPGGKRCAYTFPVEAGDECVVIFADRCIDAWVQSGGVQNPVTGRRHDLADGFALVGFRSGKTVLRGDTDDGIGYAAMLRGNVIDKEQFEKIRPCEANRGAMFTVAEDDGDHAYMSLKRGGEIRFVKIT